MRQRLSLEEKKDLVQKVKDFSKNENTGIKDACKQLDIPFWKYYGALKSVKSEGKKTKTRGRTPAIISTKGELKIDLVFKGDAAQLVRDYVDAYGVEPEIICKIILIDALKEKKKPMQK
jgi:hypothetical protein